MANSKLQYGSITAGLIASVCSSSGGSTDTIFESEINTEPQKVLRQVMAFTQRKGKQAAADFMDLKIRFPASFQSKVEKLLA